MLWLLALIGSGFGGPLDVVRLPSGAPVRQSAFPVVESLAFSLGRTSIVRWVEQEPSGAQGYYAISRDGARVDRFAPVDGTIRLRSGHFDPLATPRALDASPFGGVYLVQLWTQPIDEYYAAVRAHGGQVLAFLPEQTLICRLPSPDRLEKLPFVRWIGPMTPADRTEPGLIAPGRVPVVVQLFTPLAAAKPAAIAFVRGSGGVITNARAQSPLFEATVPADAIRGIAGRPEVAWVERAVPDETDMDIARQIGGADFIESIGGYAGQGVRGQVIDTGVRASHVDFASRPLIVRTNTGDMSHGTCVTGIVFGDGTGLPMGRGMLPQGQGIFAAISQIGDRYQHTSVLVQPPYECVFETNSWGGGTTRDYTSRSAEIDRIVFDFDILICQSQGNTGTTNSRPEAWAKNNIAVGGIAHKDTLTKTDDEYTTASRGPGVDNRVKPDLSHFYDNVLCPGSSHDMSYNPFFGGTSAATPITAGHFGLLYQMWAEGAFGNSVAASTVFGARMHSSTARALMICHAAPYPFSGMNDNLGRYRQGWGMADLRNVLDAARQSLIVDETDVLRNLDVRQFRVYVPSGAPELRATMTYRDVPGTTSSTRHRINDLDLRLVSPFGIEYWGNNNLLLAPFNDPGGTPDDVNPVENVFIPAPVSGVWTVEVRATAINADGYPDTPGVLDSPYALVVSGGATRAYPDWIDVRAGGHISGSVDEVATSDNRRYVVRSTGAMSALSGVVLDVEAACVVPEPGTLQMRIEARGSLPGVSARVEMFDYTQGRYVYAGDFTLGASDTFLTAPAPGEATRFRDAKTGRVAARLTFRRVQESVTQWVLGVDQIVWDVEP